MNSILSTARCIANFSFTLALPTLLKSLQALVDPLCHSFKTSAGVRSPVCVVYIKNMLGFAASRVL